jgi:VIT1/CCC1 family predicted Fe2+/Mn2+ transporter
MEQKILKIALKAQKNEVTEHHIYMKLSALTKDNNNADILRRIGTQELEHSDYWKSKTGIDIKPDQWRISRTVILARLLGLSFVLKQMEKREGTGSKLYLELSKYYPETKKISDEESEHEKKVLNMLDEEKLQYIGSIVLGLNDALVELTGALAGFTLALGNTILITMAGLVTGISAALSMAASDYLSSKAEGDLTAKKSALYTGITYLITVFLLILPFLLVSSKFIALIITLVTAVIIIFCFNYYTAVAKDLNFKARFTEMTLISLGVATFSFILGYALKAVLGVDA